MRTSWSPRDIASKIQQTYEESLSTLSWRHQEHYCARMYRISGHKAYCHPIYAFFLNQQKNYLKLIRQLDQTNGWHRWGQQIITNTQANQPRSQLKKNYYQKNPPIIGLIDFISKINKLKTYHLRQNPPWHQIYNSALTYLRHQQTYLQKILLNPQLMAVDPSETINTCFYLQQLGIINITNQLENLINSVYFPGSQLNQPQFISLVYAYTHLIINQSNFYQNFVVKPPPKILKWFSQNIDQIMANTNLDVIAEVGVCLRLCQQTNPTCRQIQSYMIKQFDPKQQLIPRQNNNTLARCEHRNILTIILLSDWNKLYPGPKLQNYAKTPSG